MGLSLAERVELRAATTADVGDIARVMFHPPEPPLARLLGPARASRLGELLVRNGTLPALIHTTVAVVDGVVVGVLECGGGSSSTPSSKGTLRLLPRILVLLGPALPRGAYGMWLRGRLEFEPRRDGFPVTELYVDESMRNCGIGGRLLEHAEDLARRAGSSRICLETGITNPARRLYERHGFQVIAEKTSVAYERLTGSPGRILMLKNLSVEA